MTRTRTRTLTLTPTNRFIQGKPEDKYRFFLKATGIDRTQEELQDTVTKLEKVCARLDTADKKMEGKRKNVANLENELQELKQLDRYETQIKECTAMSAWIDVTAKSDELEAATSVVTKCERVLGEAVSKRDGLGIRLEEEKEVTDDMVTEAQAAVRKASDEKERSAQAQRQKREYRGLIENEISSVLVSVTTMEKQKRSAEKNRADILRKAEQTLQQDQKKFVHEVKECDAELAQLDAQKKSMKKDKDALMDLKSAEEEKQRTHKNVVNQNKRQLSILQEQLKDMNSSKNELFAYGKNYLSFVNKLERARGQFKGEVAAPAGKYVKIKEDFKSDWLAIEAALGHNLRAVFVNDMTDHRLVAKMMKEAGIIVDIILIPTRGKRYTVGSVSGGITVADCITVSSDLVFNGLAERANIASTLVLRDHDDYKKWVHGGGFQQGVSMCIDQEGTKIRQRNGNKMNEPLMKNSQRLLQNDAEAAKQALRDEIEEVKGILGSFSSAEDELKRAAREIQGQLLQLTQNLTNIDATIKKVNRKKEAANTKLSEITDAEKNQDVSHLDQEIHDLCVELETNQQQLQKSRGDLESVMSEQTELDAFFKAAEKTWKDARKEWDTLMERQQSYVTAREKFLRDQKMAANAVEKAETTLESARVTRGRLEEKLEEVTNKAADITSALLGDEWDGNPLRVRGKTKEKLAKKRQDLQVEYDHKKVEIGMANKSKEQVMGRLMAAKDDLDKSEKQLVELKELMLSLRRDCKKRQKKLEQMRKVNSKTVKSVFNDYLQNKKMMGRVVFDHDDMTLGMVVQTDDSNVNSKSSDVRNMSGGERSYVTLCLLLALGHVIECPFRLMDEYDVFMDQITRKTTLRQIQEYAVAPEQHGRQFIIITPQDLSDVTVCNDVRVHRVKPPVRGAARGTQQATVTEAFGGGVDSEGEGL